MLFAMEKGNDVIDILMIDMRNANVLWVKAATLPYQKIIIGQALYYINHSISKKTLVVTLSFCFQANPASTGGFTSGRINTCD